MWPKERSRLRIPPLLRGVLLNWVVYLRSQALTVLGLLRQVFECDLGWSVSKIDSHILNCIREA